MSDVNETLQDLMERRLKELGKRRGRGESISLREAYQRFLDQHNDEGARRADEGVVDDRPAPPTYEVFRRIRSKGHTRITDTTASALATMLDVPLDVVYAAAKIKPRLGRFELPTRADRLDDRQRRVVLDVVDAILLASEPNQRPQLGVVHPLDEDLDALPDEREEQQPIPGATPQRRAARRRLKDDP